MDSRGKEPHSLRPEEKAAALRNIELVLSEPLRLGGSSNRSFIVVNGVKQGLTLQEVKTEIENETETGFIFAKAWRKILF